VIRHWPLAVVLVVQLGFLGAIVGGQLHLRSTGTEITLRTVPVDPYDLLSGYYLDLRYEVEQKVGPLGGAERGDLFWITVRRGPEVWEYVNSTPWKPDPAPDHVHLRAVWRGGARLVGADRLYLPEAQRDRAEQLTREFEGRGLVDLVVGEDGELAVIRLRLGEQSFGG
jgi:hypothetical protein